MEPQIYATLTPINALARLALSETYDVLTAGQQNSLREGPLCRMKVEPQQRYNKDVSQLRRELQRRSDKGDGFTSDSLTEPESANEIENNQQLGTIWEGQYLLGFNPQPRIAEVGWRVGKSSQVLNSQHPDLVLCTPVFAKKHSLNIRTAHARFNFCKENSALFIAGRRSQHAELKINGIIVTEQLFALNQRSMKVDFDRLTYELRFTAWADTEEFKSTRRRYLTTVLGVQAILDFEMPTPRHDVQMMGNWTLAQPLGRGGIGRVFLASNAKNEVAAVKIMDRDSDTQHSVDEEISTLERLTALARNWGETGSMVQLREVVGKFSDAPFEQVAVVLIPMTPNTFWELVQRKNESWNGMKREEAQLFRSLLLQVKVLHDRGWLHGDLKPANVGIIGTPQRAVLLDIGNAKHLRPGCHLNPTPGSGGTIGYIAPEREMESYDRSIDIWSLGVIGYEITYGHPPWKQTQNPWRRDRCNSLREAFHKQYDDTITKLASDSKVVPMETHIQLGELITQMLRHSRARQNNHARICINEALKHPAWGSLRDDMPREAKRQKGLS
ncbi:hypothetical protein M0657_011062 [Pyricularia oryzae]|uniref:Protein kinase domain-containing protein n=1 Tax=Pyricularia grisea TaxID=148305 RepID=A0A6P8BIJ5_PYRGI|nr:uncharacterized protein PgNI_01112 [Pyricularia grisea]KAI7911190.1 hypothetical protein M0657_011062 [Pyricularia oryzae]TLD16459.1 hypothetical protein PgNI_01112 [Pyricularia grisea]